MARNPIVHIVDDETAVREALSHLLCAAGLDTRCHASAEAFLADLDAQTPGCVVIDVCMPGISGLALQAKLSASGQQIPVVFLTGHADVPMAVEAMLRGATSFLQKPPRSHELLEVVKNAVMWHQVFLQRLTESAEIDRRLETLTDREREILTLVTDGKSSKEIGCMLGIGQRTVEQHRSNLLQKLDVDSLAELVRITIRDQPTNGKCTSKCAYAFAKNGRQDVVP